MIGFDADVLIYAANPNHPLGDRISQVLTAQANQGKLVGSTLLLPELLIKPVRHHRQVELQRLRSLLARLRLLPSDLEVAGLAMTLGARYGLKSIDAVHLATAVHSGADTFITNNHKDFKTAQVLELDIIYPAEL